MLSVGALIHDNKLYKDTQKIWVQKGDRPQILLGTAARDLHSDV